MAKEVFHLSVVIASTLPAHALPDALIRPHLNILFMPVMPALAGAKQQLRIIRDLGKGLFQHGSYHQQIGTFRQRICHNVSTIPLGIKTPRFLVQVLYHTWLTNGV